MSKMSFFRYLSVCTLPCTPKVPRITKMRVLSTDFFLLYVQISNNMPIFGQFQLNIGKICSFEAKSESLCGSLTLKICLYLAFNQYFNQTPTKWGTFGWDSRGTNLLDWPLIDLNWAKFQNELGLCFFGYIL